jgi:methyltransferase (TIGR00027 family)
VASSPALRNVSDTALLVAVHRARESERTDALFRDPYARPLAGERGERIARELASGLSGWPVVGRTLYFDEVIARMAGSGRIGCVLNLAAGLDARPYRLDLPRDLLWVEADLPDMLEYKVERMVREVPRCRLERVAGDLNDLQARVRAADATAQRPTLVVTEGLLVYLAKADVVGLARDLAARANFDHWLLDISSPQAMSWEKRGNVGRQLASANASHRFAPPDGFEFFRPYGWQPVEVRSLWEEARKLDRLPGFLRLLEAITPRTHRELFHSVNRVGLLQRAKTEPANPSRRFEDTDPA